ELLDQVISNAHRMRQLIDDLLHFSRLNRQPFRKQAVPTLAIVQALIGELRREHNERPLEIRLGELPDCIGDRSLLTQVFANLLSNALKFTRHQEKGIIEVGYTHPGDEGVYFVRDNGA